MRSFNSLLATPVAAVVVVGTVLICFASPPPDSETILWPIGPGTTPQVVGNNHGQLLSEVDGAVPKVHRGLDLLPNPATTSHVFAVADGVVLRCSLGDGMHGNLDSGLVIGTANDALVYWHLEPGSITKKRGDTVAVDDLLGKLATWSPVEFTHLHFERARPNGPKITLPGYGEYVSWVPYESIESPASRLCSDLASDPIGQTPLEIRFVDNATNELLPVDGAVTGKVDVVARVVDAQRAEHTEWTRSWALIPYRLDLSIVGPVGDPVGTPYPVVFEKVLVVDGSIKETEIGEVANNLYQTSGAWKSKGTLFERTLYIVVTGVDAADTRGRSLRDATVASEPWDTSDLSNSGTYRVTVNAFDAANNQVGGGTADVDVVPQAEAE